MFRIEKQQASLSLNTSLVLLRAFTFIYQSETN